MTDCVFCGIASGAIACAAVAGSEGLEDGYRAGARRMGWPPG